MGKCSSVLRTFKHQDDKALIEGKQMMVEEGYGKSHQNMMRKIDLINNWQSYQLETIVEKIMAMCQYEKKNHMNFTLFLQFFPALKPMSMKTQIRYFDLFDFTRSSYINIREIIFGISQIYFTPKPQYSQVLKEIYKRSKDDYLTSSELKLFLHQNKSLLSKAIKTDKALEKNILNKQPMLQSNFDLMIAKYFQIPLYQRYFDFYDTELQISILDSLRSFDKKDQIQSKKSNNLKYRSDKKFDQDRLQEYKTDDKKQQDKKLYTFEIRISNGDRVFLVAKEWFETWIKYMAIHSCYQIIYQIEGSNENIFERKNFSFDESFMENAKLTRPPKIYNYDLLSEYETDLKPNLKIFQDFIPLPQKMWKKLITIYKGGPEIQRVYPHLFDTIVINKVFVDNKAKFVEGRVVRCILQPNQLISEIFKAQNRAGCIYFKRIPISNNRNNISSQQLKVYFKWSQINKTTEIDESLRHGFICFVPLNLKSSFQTNYKSFGPPPSNSDINLIETIQKQNRFSYGQLIEFKTHVYNTQSSNIYENLKIDAYVIDMRRTQVKLHFVGYSDTCDDYYSIEELTLGVEDKKYVVSTKNVISTFQNLQNCSHINAVLQVLIASPFFSDYFLKQKHIRSLSHDTNLQTCLSTSFSKVIYDVKRHQKQSVRPEDLYKKIHSKVQDFNFDGTSKDYPEKFISRFLQILASQLGNPEKLFDKYPLITNFQQSNNESKDLKFKGSIIQAFFKLSQSTKSICSTPSCKSEYINTTYSYTLKVPLPEDEQVCYSIIFCPMDSKQFTKYGITIRKSEKFIMYAHKFSQLIKIDLSRLSFGEVKNNEFRKHYTEIDYESSLFNLDLNSTDSIYVFELRNHRFNREMMQEDQTFHDNFLKLDIGDIVDFNMYTQWHVGRIINFNKDKIVIENFDGQSQVQKKRIESFKAKTQEKGWYQIDLLHRRVNKEKQDRLQYFLTPSIITIAEWMSWGSVFAIIKNYVRNYFDLQQNKSAYGQQEVVDKLIMDILQFCREAPERQSFSPHNSQREMSNVFGEEDIAQNASNKSTSTKVDNPKFSIKVFLKNSGEVCAICGKKSLFHKQSGHFDVKYCYGCSLSLDYDEPIGIKVNPAKISVVLDWIPLQVDPLISTVLFKIKSDSTYQNVTTKIKNQINTIDDCFQLYIETNKNVEIDCKKCGRNMGQQTRYLSQCPNMLILHLNRFKTYKNLQYKLNNKIQVKRELTIQKIQMQSKKQDIYQLYGIICHRQINMHVQKWYACVLKTRNVWIKCQDTHASLIDFNKIEKDEIYMLLYRKKNIKCTILSMIF